MRQPEDAHTLELELEPPKRWRRSSRGDYYPDTMSRQARKVVQAARDWRFWRDRAAGFPSGVNIDHEELAGEVARWHAFELFSAHAA